MRKHYANKIVIIITCANLDSVAQIVELFMMEDSVTVKQP